MIAAVAMEMNVCVVMCPDCGKDFKSIGPLKAHMKEVHEYENLMCGECGKEFKNQARVKIHERLVHVRVDKVEYCDQCEKVFKNKGEVFHHRNAVHTIELIRSVTVLRKISMHLESISRNVQKRIPV